MTTIQKLQETVLQVAHLMRRITDRRHGLEKQGTTRLTQALITSRITYGTPYLALKNSERDKLNILIRKTYKLVLGLAPITSTEKLLQLGIHNSRTLTW